MKLFGYFRSSAAFRVRIALNLKGLKYEPQLINLSTGEHLSEKFLEINPQGRVPVLQVNEEEFFQSSSIIEYIDEKWPEPPLLPNDAKGRAFARSIANIIACDIHPLNNLSVLKYLTSVLKVGEIGRSEWYQHWVDQGFNAVEKLLNKKDENFRFSLGNIPGFIDVFLVPQVFNAKRFNCNLSNFPTINRIFAECMKIEAFQKAEPSKQPEAQAFE